MKPHVCLLLAAAVAVVSCGQDAVDPGSSTPAAETPAATAEEPAGSATTAPGITITGEGMGPARLGMTLGALKQAFPEATYEVTSPFMVDIDAITVSVGEQVQFYILHLSSDPLGDTDAIELLMTDNPDFRTAEGVGPGTTIQQAESLYGKATLNHHTAYESREYVEFEELPYAGMGFRSDQWGGRDFAGIYADNEGGEYFTTGEYRDGATIGAVRLQLR